jgi:transposase
MKKGITEKAQQGVKANGTSRKAGGGRKKTRGGAKTSLPAEQWKHLLAVVKNNAERLQVIGIDTGDRTSELCFLSEDGKVIQRGAMATGPGEVKEFFEQLAPVTVVLETGTHSPWMSRVLAGCGHEVLVANARQVSRVLKNKKKTDKRDAEQLARLARADRSLLGEVTHRSEQAQMTMSKLQVRVALIQTRTKLCNVARGLVKSAGYRLVKVEPERMSRQVSGALPEQLQQLIASLLEQVEQLNRQIAQLDEELQQTAKSKHPETRWLDQIWGVGPIVSLAFAVTIDDPKRFRQSRTVGSYLGLTPALDQSGESNPQLRISKEGSRMMRALLVNSAQCILRKKSPDCDLKRHGEKIAARGGKIARKKAVVAVARKLAVLLHKLWASRSKYEPLRNGRSEPGQGAEAALAA